MGQDIRPPMLFAVLLMTAGAAWAQNAPPPAVPAARSTQVTINNGHRTIVIKAGEETIEITDTNGKDIALRHERLVDGKKKSDKYAAPDLPTLQKNHPEAAELYRKNTAGVMVQMQVRGANAAPFSMINPALSPIGSRRIQARIHGQKVEIEDVGGRDIRIKVTPRNPEAAKEFRAADPETLRREHPSIAELYDQLTGR